MLNHVELLGRLAQEPEIRYTQSGTPVASFDLAVQVPSKNKDAAPDYIPIVCWRERAEFCGRYLSKGRQIVVEGRISTRKWKDEKTGQNRKAVEVVASNIYFADSNGGNANGNAKRSRLLHNVADINAGNIPGGPSSPGKPKEDKNMLIINIVLALVAALLLFGVIGEKDGLRQQNITIAFVAVIVLIIALNRFF